MHILIITSLFLTFSFSLHAQDKISNDDLINITSQFEFKSDKPFKSSIDIKDLEDPLIKTITGLNFLMKHSKLQKINFLEEQGVDFIGENPWVFFVQRVKKIILVSNGIYMCGVTSTTNPDNHNGAVLAFVRNEDKSTIYICSEIIGSWPSWAVAAILMHEARHLDSNHNKHVHCTQGVLKADKPDIIKACDQNIYDGDSFSVQVEYLVRLYRDPSLDRNLKEYIKGWAIFELENRFNTQVPWDINKLFVEH